MRILLLKQFFLISRPSARHQIQASVIFCWHQLHTVEIPRLKCENGHMTQLNNAGSKTGASVYILFSDPFVQHKYCFK